MHFSFIDRVLQWHPGVSITTLKCLTLGEEYLADHFPRFPVMPGVLMVQTLTDAGALLVAATEDFAHSMITLKEARNVRFADFVVPGRVLTVTAELLSIEGPEVQLKAHATMAGRMVVSGRLVLARYNLADARPDRADTDAALKRHWRSRWNMLRPAPLEPAAIPWSQRAMSHGQLAAPAAPVQGKV